MSILLLKPDKGKDIDITEVILQIREKFRPKVESYRQLIQELENPELTPLEKAEKIHKINRLEIEALRPLLKLVIFDTFENYRYTVIDIGYECEIMNHIWQGCESEHIAGAYTLEELKRNRQLLNYVIERLVNILGNDKSLIEWQIANLWIKNHRRNQN